MHLAAGIKEWSPNTAIVSTHIHTLYCAVTSSIRKQAAHAAEQAVFAANWVKSIDVQWIHTYMVSDNFPIIILIMIFIIYVVVIVTIITILSFCIPLC